MLTPYSPENGGRVPSEFYYALDLTESAAETVFGIPIPVDYDVRLTTDEEAIQFPAQIIHTDRYNAIINIHLESLEDRYGHKDGEEIEDLETGLTFADITKLHVAGAVIPHMLICAVDPRDKSRLAKLAEYMSHDGSLASSISENLLTTELFKQRLREEVAGRGPDQIAEINRLRLAIGALGYAEDTAGGEQVSARQNINFTQNVSKRFLQQLTELPAQLENYVETAEKFGMDRHAAERNFLMTVSSLEFAAAFPMGLPEISLLARHISGAPD